MRKDAAEGSKLYYAQVRSLKKLKFEKFCNMVAVRSSAFVGDVKLVIDGILSVMEERLEEGDVIQLGRLGNFRMVAGSKGVFSCIPGTFYSTFAVVYASMLPYTALAYDERSRWDQMAAMMPYSARDVVLSKYLFGWIAVAVSAAATFVLQTILSVIWLSDVEGPSIPVILLSVCVAVCILDITLPMMFRFGVEKGRLAMFLIIFLVCASAGGIATIEQSSLDGGFYLSLSLVPAAIAAVVLTVVSIPLAIRFYGRRSR